MSKPTAVPSVSVTYAQDGSSTRSNELGMRPMQERAYNKRGEQYLLIKSPPASGKSRALMFIALDKLENQGLRQAIIVVPEKSIGASFHNESLSQFGFWADWVVEPRWNLCDAPGTDGGKVDAVKQFLEGSAQVLVCTHATFRFAVEKFGVEVLDDRLIAVDEFHHAAIHQGDLFVLDGQKALVAAMGEQFISDYGQPNAELRVVYDNGTESNLLLRSLQRALNKDKASRRITRPETDLGPLFSQVQTKNDLETGYIYVLRSQSDDPFIAEHRSTIHKIGVTTGDVKKRVANAKKDPTYLLADVEIVTTFKLANINPRGLEALLHRFFSSARLNVELSDRFGVPVQPREWFLVPLEVIEEVVEKIQAGTIDQFRYNPETASLMHLNATI
jgi:hypothetical protein